jgi:hypothetical protein
MPISQLIVAGADKMPFLEKAAAVRIVFFVLCL